MSASAKKVYALINLKSGRCDADRIESDLRSAASARNVTLEICRTRKGKRKKTRQAIQGGADCVIAAGGDGTVSKVASEAAGTNVSVGIIPAGTANLLARELGIPDDTTEAINVIFNSQATRSLDGMQINGGHIMFSHISVGTYSRIAENKDATAKRRFGKAFYLWQAFRELRKANRWKFRIDVDRTECRRTASLVLMANICPVGVSGLTWGEQIRPDDAAIDICIVRAVGVRQHLALLCHAARGRTAASDQIEYLRARSSVRVCPASILPVRADGKVVDEGNVDIRVVPKAAGFIVPDRENTAADIEPVG